MRIKVLVVFLLVSLISLSQDEILQPLQMFSSMKSIKRNTKDTVFIYNLDTLFLPIIDDFSKNHFQKYPRITSGSTVKQTKYYKFLDFNNKKVDIKKYTSTIPKKYVYVSQTKKDSIIDLTVSSIKLKVADFISQPIK